MRDRDRLKIERSLQDLSKEKIPDYRKGPTRRARISLEDPHDLAKLMEVLHLVRNNMFHGHKSPTNEEDLRIVNLAYEVLSFLMGYVAHAIQKRFSIVETGTSRPPPYLRSSYGINTLDNS